MLADVPWRWATLSPLIIFSVYLGDGGGDTPISEQILCRIFSYRIAGKDDILKTCQKIYSPLPIDFTPCEKTESRGLRARFED